MSGPAIKKILDELANGRTELVFDLVPVLPADYADESGVLLIRHCAYYGDVSAIRFLLSHGESLSSLGENLGLEGASFHGHWRLCKFFLEQGSNVNHTSPGTGETALHAALCKTDRMV